MCRKFLPIRFLWNMMGCDPSIHQDFHKIRSAYPNPLKKLMLGFTVQKYAHVNNPGIVPYQESFFFLKQNWGSSFSLVFLKRKSVLFQMFCFFLQARVAFKHGKPFIYLMLWESYLSSSLVSKALPETGKCKIIFHRIIKLEWTDPQGHLVQTLPVALCDFHRYHFASFQMWALRELQVFRCVCALETVRVYWFSTAKL